jgi:hypothetical protein
MIVSLDPCEPITAAQWEELRVAWPDAERLRTAWNLALDVDTLADLIVGVPVAPGRLDPAELAEAREESLIVLVAPISLLDVTEANSRGGGVMSGCCVVWRCSDCEEILDVKPEEPYYCCDRCGEGFSRENSADGDSHRCPGCGGFGSREGFACTECGEGPVKEGVLDAEGNFAEPPPKPPEPPDPARRFEHGYVEADDWDLGDQVGMAGWYVWDNWRAGPSERAVLVVVGPFATEDEAEDARQRSTRAATGEAA